ncbi:MAG: phosphatase PAP2 family protein [Candidatus Riflebacteria bacterium]|nr:phosphatase PAP2 family protein [Candidatus Riflebacteria bacterium]
MLELDRSLFALINGVWTTPWLDEAMPLVTNAKLWAPFLAVVWLWLLLGAGGRRRPLALCLLVAIGLSDLVSARVVKPLAGRDRPCIAEPAGRLLVSRTSSRSYPSSHATNAGAAATVVWAEAGWAAGLPVLLLALAVSWSRVYVGVHYPVDVVAGLCLGLAIARIVILLRRRWWPIPVPGPGGAAAADPPSGAPTREDSPAAAGPREPLPPSSSAGG